MLGRDISFAVGKKKAGQEATLSVDRALLALAICLPSEPGPV